MKIRYYSVKWEQNKSDFVEVYMVQSITKSKPVRLALCEGPKVARCVMKLFDEKWNYSLTDLVSL